MQGDPGKCQIGTTAKLATKRHHLRFYSLACTSIPYPAHLPAHHLQPVVKASPPLSPGAAEGGHAAHILTCTTAQAHAMRTGATLQYTICAISGCL